MKKNFWSIVFVLAICLCAAFACLGLAGADESGVAIARNSTSLVNITTPIISQEMLQNFTSFKPKLGDALFQRTADQGDFFALEVNAGAYTSFIQDWEAYLYTQDPAIAGQSNVTMSNGQVYKEIAIMTVPNDVSAIDPQSNTTKVTGYYYYYGDVPPAGTIVYIAVQGEIWDGNNSKYVMSDYSNMKRVQVPVTGEMNINNTTINTGIDIADAIITLTNETAVYTGSEIKPGVVSVVLNGTTLVSGTDYDITYKDNVEPGTGYVIATGKGNYKGQAKTSFKIIKDTSGINTTVPVTGIDISEAVITLANTTIVFDGQAKEPEVVSVVLNGTLLKAGTDYTVSWEDNVNAGTGKAVVTGQGNYKGKAIKDFLIEKAPNEISMKPVKKTLKLKTLAKKKQTISLKISVLENAKKTVKLKSVPKKAKKYITVSKKGKITVKKGCPKGKFKVRLQITAAETMNYRETTEIKIITITVK